jgi:endonuclease YncB( thermonuclease family)
VRRWCIRRDVGKEMLKAGLATVYEANSGAEFGAFEQKYRDIEANAKRKRTGMWAGKKEDFESPRAYKTRTANLGENKPK